MRHLLLEFPDDAKTYDCDDEYLIGDKILVAPVIEQGATSRSLYLPQGSWTDYWTGTVLDGGRNITVAAPLRQIPIFVRAGSILPLLSPDTETLAQDLASGKISDLVWRPDLAHLRRFDAHSQQLRTWRRHGCRRVRRFGSH